MRAVSFRALCVTIHNSPCSSPADTEACGERSIIVRRDKDASRNQHLGPIQFGASNASELQRGQYAAVIEAMQGELATLTDHAQEGPTASGSWGAAGLYRCCR